LLHNTQLAQNPRGQFAWCARGFGGEGGLQDDSAHRLFVGRDIKVDVCHVCC